MKLSKIIYTIIGCLSLALGSVGAVLPILPTVPFLMLSALCFAKSSEKLNTWFKQAKIYKNNLESYVRGEGMTMRTKTKILLTVTALMAVGFVVMLSKKVYIGFIALSIVWLVHILYFTLAIKTIPIQNDLN